MIGNIQLIKSVLQVPEQPVPVNGLGKIPKDLKPHGLIQIIIVGCNNKDFDVWVCGFQLCSGISTSRKAISAVSFWASNSSPLWQLPTREAIFD